jgi:hypothetical protein
MCDRQAVNLVLKALEQTVSEMEHLDRQDLRIAIELDGAANLAMGAAGPATTVMLLAVSALLKLNAESKHSHALLASLAKSIKDVMQRDNEFDDSCPF